MAGKAKEENEVDNDILVIDEPEESIQSGEIDSSSDDEAEKEKVVQKKNPVKKRGNDQQKRLNEIWLGRKQAEEEANRQAIIAAQERAKSTQYEQITASALEENINTKRDLLKERMIRAQESGDAAKIADIQIELGKIEAQGAQIDRYKLENRVNSTDSQNKPSDNTSRTNSSDSPDDMYERMSPAGKKWLDENSDWYENTGDNHDPDKAGDVKYYAQTLEHDLVRSGRGAEIGTKAYFKKINDYIKQNWSDEMPLEEDEEDAPPAQQKRNYAAPVGNRSPQSTPAGARKEYKISQSEKEMALSLDMKDRSGNPLSDNDKIKRFINLRESVPSDGPISMKTLKKGS